MSIGKTVDLSQAAQERFRPHFRFREAKQKSFRWLIVALSLWLAS